MTDTAAKRIVRMPVPPLIYRSPMCPLCDGDVSWEEGWVCESCSAVWPDNFDDAGEVSEYYFHIKPQCEAYIEPFDTEKYPDMAGRRYRCVRDLDHASGSSYSDRFHIGIRVDGEKPDPRNTYEWF